MDSAGSTTPSYPRCAHRPEDCARGPGVRLGGRSRGLAVGLGGTGRGLGLGRVGHGLGRHGAVLDTATGWCQDDPS